MPSAVIRGMAILKKAAALVNRDLGKLSGEEAELIVAAADEILAGSLDDHFPLFVWQTGSGTQTNMNVNEVISNRAIELAGGSVGSKKPIHPNDHVNMSQSSNDTFPTAMHIAAAEEIVHRLVPSVARAPRRARREGRRVRRHRQDRPHAPPGRRAAHARAGVLRATSRSSTPTSSASRRRCRGSTSSRIGGTAVGTGLNTHPSSPTTWRPKIAELTGLPFVTAPNKFAALAAHDALVFASGALQDARGVADEDRQRHPLARVRPARRARRADPAGERARLVDHAGQGEPDAERGA